MYFIDDTDSTQDRITIQWVSSELVQKADKVQEKDDKKLGSRKRVYGKL